MYFKTAIWLPNLYRNQDFWGNFELKCQVANALMTCLYAAFGIVWWIERDLDHQDYIIYYSIYTLLGLVPIVIISFSLISISRTVSRMGY